MVSKQLNETFSQTEAYLLKGSKNSFSPKLCINFFRIQCAAHKTFTNLMKYVTFSRKVYPHTIWYFLSRMFTSTSRMLNSNLLQMQNPFCAAKVKWNCILLHDTCREIRIKIFRACKYDGKDLVTVLKLDCWNFNLEFCQNIIFVKALQQWRSTILVISKLHFPHFRI